MLSRSFSQVYEKFDRVMWAGVRRLPAGLRVVWVWGIGVTSEWMT
jgi:hypothetical protein